jgi:hypothetical protein
LTRRPGDLPEGGDERLKTMKQVELNPENLPKPLPISACDLRRGCYIQQQLEEAAKQDDLVQRTLDMATQGTSLKEITVRECSEEN